MCIQEHVPASERLGPQPCLGVRVAATEDSTVVICSCIANRPRLGALNSVSYYFSRFCELIGFSGVVLWFHAVVAALWKLGTSLPGAATF